MSQPRFDFAGYFPKRILPRPDWLAAPAVREIWSVSHCMSKAPEGWIDHWKHNAQWLYDTVALAESVVPPGERDAFSIVGYRVAATMFDEGDEVPLDEAIQPLPGPEVGFESLGFDAVGRLQTTFACSPLSCNHAADKLATNEHCLFRTVQEAMPAAREFSRGGWEPGPYWIVEVLRRR